MGKFLYRISIVFVVLMECCLTLQAQSMKSRDASKDNIAVKPKNVVKPKVKPESERPSASRTASTASSSNNRAIKHKNKNVVRHNKSSLHNRSVVQNADSESTLNDSYSSGNNIYDNNANRQASFLTVNGKTNCITYAFSYGEILKYNVETDVLQWYVYGLPFWCQLIRQTEDEFEIQVLSNPSSTLRKSFFYVQCGNQQVKVEIEQFGSTSNSK